MAISHRIRSRTPNADYWPGFVDAMATLLLVLVFLLSIFMLTQFFLAQSITGKDSALDRLRNQVSELADLLALAQLENADLQSTVASLSTALSSAQDEQSRLAAMLAEGAGSGDREAALLSELDDERRISAQALAQVELVNQQLAALRRQLAALEQALEAAEAKDRESDAQIADLGRRLNSALAQKVQELARYRSDFFARLKEALGNRDDIEVVGDRFVLQSEIFFASGSAEISPAGQRELRKIAVAIREITAEIPGDINWILRVDGHTDATPIRTSEFPSNWHLANARALSVVQYLIDGGVSERRLSSAGFAEFHPLVDGSGETVNRRNRRIEFKLTER